MTQPDGNGRSRPMTLLALRRQLLRALWEWRIAMKHRNTATTMARLCEVVAIRRTIVRWEKNDSTRDSAILA